MNIEKYNTKMFEDIKHIDEQGNVYVNYELLDEPYIADDIETVSNAYSYFTVPEGHVFLMGDNRTKSADCRDFGCIPFDKIEGKASFRFWPLNVFGKIDD